MEMFTGISQLIAERFSAGLHSITASYVAHRMGIERKEATKRLLKYSESAGSENFSPIFMIEIEDPYESKDITALIRDIDDLDSGKITVEGFAWHEDPVIATAENTYLVFGFTARYGSKVLEAMPPPRVRENGRGELSPRQ